MQETTLSVDIFFRVLDTWFRDKGEWWDGIHVDSVRVTEAATIQYEERAA